MKIAQFIQTAALILLLSVTTVESAQAGIGFSSVGRSGGSSVFKSGFSSQKHSVPSHGTERAAGKNTSFGSFGATGNAAPLSTNSATSSALSRNLNATAANSAALKTLDARTQSAVPVAPAFNPSYANGGAGYSSPPMYTPAAIPHTVIVQRDSGFSGSPFLWFMLGHSMAGQGRDRVVYERPAYPADTVMGDPAAGADAAPVVAMREPQESIGARFLRVVLWLAIIAALAAGAIYFLTKRAARAAAAHTHYSLGKI